MKKDQAESYYSAFTVLSICRDENVLGQHCSNLLGSSERDGFSGDGHCVSGVCFLFFFLFFFLIHNRVPLTYFISY